VCCASCAGFSNVVAGDEICPMLNLRDRIVQAIASILAWVRRDWIVLLVLLAAALALIHPVLVDPRGRVIGWAGDNVQYAYMTGWTAQALLLGQSPLVDPRLNYPDGLVLAATDVPFASMLMVAPFTWVLGPVFGYNLIILLSGLLSGYFAYLWVRSLTGSRFGGLVAGLAFLLAPYRFVHAYGHLQLVSTQALPLFFWALDRALAPRPGRRALLALAAATCFVGLLSQYYLVMCLVLGPVYVLLALALLRNEDHPENTTAGNAPRLPVRLLLLGLVAASVLLGAVLAALPYLTAGGERLYVPRPAETTRMWSADPLNFVLPARYHPLWGGVVERWRPEALWIEQTLYVGAVTLALALVALCWRVGDRRRWVWLGMALAAFVLALGTDLHSGGEPVRAEEPFWLPAYYLAQLPFVNLMRTWSRFGIITILFVSLLAGMGAAVPWSSLRRTGAFERRRRARWQVVPAALLVGLLLLDLLPGRAQTTALGPRAVDRWLAQQPGEFALAALPARNDQVSYAAAFGSLYHARHVVSYNHPDHLPRAYREFMRLAAPFPDEIAFVRLRQFGLRYLLLERSRFDGRTAPQWSAVETALERNPGGARVVAELDDVVVVALR
jgi:hypothetical protein